MPIDLKYGRVTLENPGTVGKDEFVFLLRAQDAMTVPMLTLYRTLCETNGSPQRHLDSIDASKDAIARWQENNHTQVPQSAPH